VRLTSVRGRRALVACAALILAACGGLTSCTAFDGGENGPDGRDASRGGNAPAEGTKNRAQWAMPLDEFIAYSPHLGNYAEQLLLGKCLTAAGYQWPVPWRDPEFPPPWDMNRVLYRLFDRSIAERWGYHLSPERDERGAKAWLEFGELVNSRAPDPAFDAKFLECSDAVRDEDTTRDVDALNYVNGLAVQAGQVAEQDPAVRAGVSAWRECVTAKVTFAVPDSTWEMPPPPLDEQFGITGPNKTATASAEEIAVAIADADCRESSGLSEARYEAEWDHQLKLVAENRDTLDRIRAEALVHKEKLLTIVAENAPAAR